MDRAFNLIDEPWIRVLTKDCEMREVSLLDAFLCAHDYISLAGESPAQDVAVLRLLLAILYAIFARVDVNGEDAPLYTNEDTEDEWVEEALERWKQLWENKCFPEQPVRTYFQKWHERFWLFDEERPFYQAHHASIGTHYGAGKLNGVIGESANKLRMFSERAGEEKAELTYSEAARWLLYLNGFDDTAAKQTAESKKRDGSITMGKAWLGSLGIVEVRGNSLFEEIMLNLTFTKGGEATWDALRSDATHQPIWELNEIRENERTSLPLPQNPAAMLTLQSRRILLDKKDNKVLGYWLLGGDQIDENRAFSEQMTAWRVRKEKDAELTIPRPHRADKQVWRDFSALTVPQNGNSAPGVMVWIGLLQQKGILGRDRLIRLRTLGIKYAGPPSNQVVDSFYDELSVHASILEELMQSLDGRAWCRRIADEVGHCEQAGDAAATLRGNLSMAAGGDETTECRFVAREELFARLDRPFRSWLEDIVVGTDVEYIDEKCREWREQLYVIASRYGKELVEAAGTAAFVGKRIKEGNRENWMSAPLAYRRFCHQMNKIVKGVV